MVQTLDTLIEYGLPPPLWPVKSVFKEFTANYQKKLKTQQAAAAADSFNNLFVYLIITEDPKKDEGFAKIMETATKSSLVIELLKNYFANLRDIFDLHIANYLKTLKEPKSTIASVIEEKKKKVGLNGAMALPGSEKKRGPIRRFFHRLKTVVTTNTVYQKVKNSKRLKKAKETAKKWWRKLKFF